jgi:5-(carboxyamino)imidazole ribonucleotide synthase
MNWRLCLSKSIRRNKTYPVVEMEFHPEANQVEYLSPRIDDAVAEKQELSPYTFLKINHVGLLAVEMFQTEDDEI